jgi:hypothetical protein
LLGDTASAHEGGRPSITGLSESVGAFCAAALLTGDVAMNTTKLAMVKNFIIIPLFFNRDNWVDNVRWSVLICNKE